MKVKAIVSVTAVVLTTGIVLLFVFLLPTGASNTGPGSSLLRGTKLWFEDLFGFCERQGVDGYQEARSKFQYDPSTGTLKSLANGREFAAGQFATPSVADLRARTIRPKPVSVQHIAIDGIMKLHALHPGAVFQAASQFNSLEFNGGHKTPEDGITNYFTDPTQGPDCALACPAGTIVRQFFSTVDDPYSGQTAEKQINLIDRLSEELDRMYTDSHDSIPGIELPLLRVKNGYTSSTQANLAAINRILSHPSSRDTLLSLIKVGVQRDVAVVYTEH